VDEYNRIGTAEAEHRRRIIPKTAFDAGQISPDQAKKLEAGGIGEMVPLQPTQPGQSLSNLLMPIVYPAIDPMLYDRQRIVNELERIWGVQEALSGAVNVAKTATEAEIQQTGFTARSSSRRDSLEAVLGDLALYTCEISRQFIDQDAAVAIAGPHAVWPEYIGADDLKKFLDVDVRAGSTGKPDTSAERESWSVLFPSLQAGVSQIAQLRGSSPTSVADALEELLRITAERAGERMNLDAIIPQADGMPAMPMPGAPMPGGPMPEQAPPAGGDWPTR